MGHYELADIRRRLHAADVHGLRVGRPDRPGRHLLRHELASTATTRCCRRSSSTTIGCDAGRRLRHGDHRVPLYIGRRNVEGGGRQQRFENTRSAPCSAFAAQISENWDYDASVQYSAVMARPVGRYNYFHKTRMARSLDVGRRDPATGAPVCRSVLDGTDPNCVPYNLFQHRRRDAGRAELPAGAGPAAGHDRPGRSTQGIDHR